VRDDAAMRSALASVVTLVVFAAACAAPAETATPRSEACSSPYFDVTQAVVAVKTSPAANVHDLAGLKSLKLGVQVGTTSYTAATAMGGALSKLLETRLSDAGKAPVLS
jgi:ABC-type amino acid transport substrate-binding protein